MAESRRLRTQADRATDDHVWRETAESRPGFATYEVTPPGSPSWWRHASIGEPEIHHHRPDRPPNLGPPPVDGETCKQWCGYCHPADERELARVRDAMDRAFAEPLDGPPRREPPPDKSWLRTTEPRRRWWHRLTPWRNP